MQFSDYYGVGARHLSPTLAATGGETDGRGASRFLPKAERFTNEVRRAMEAENKKFRAAARKESDFVYSARFSILPS